MYLSFTITIGADWWLDSVHLFAAITRTGADVRVRYARFLREPEFVGAHSRLGCRPRRLLGAQVSLIGIIRLKQLICVNFDPEEVCTSRKEIANIEKSSLNLNQIQKQIPQRSLFSSLVINNGINEGTQLPYIRRAKKLGYAVLILNTNDNYRNNRYIPVWQIGNPFSINLANKLTLLLYEYMYIVSTYSYIAQVFRKVTSVINTN